MPPGPRTGAARPVAAPDVSVCIANWNCRDYLRGCLESLLDDPQGVTVEVVVVDNASADGAADMVAREFPEVVLIRNAGEPRVRPGQQPGGRAGPRPVPVLPEQRHRRPAVHAAPGWSPSPTPTRRSA